MAVVEMLEGVRFTRPGVPAGALDRAGMYEVARQFFAQHEVTPPDDLWAEDQVEVGAGKKGGVRARYEIRHRQIRRVEVSVIACQPPMTADPWLDLLDLLYNERLKDLRAENDAADWRLVGVLIHQVDQSKVHVQRGGTGAGRVNMPAAQSIHDNSVWNDGDLAAMTRRAGGPVTAVPERNVAMMAELVFADLSTGEDWANPADKHPEYKPGSAPMEKYAQGRLMSQMPLALRNERKEARRVMDALEAAKRRAEEAARPVPVDPLERFTAEALRDFLAAMPEEKVADLLGCTVEALRAKAGIRPEPPTETTPDKAKGRRA